jgi:hypothetical protein
MGGKDERRPKEPSCTISKEEKEKEQCGRADLYRVFKRF